jgi:tricorn protease-like protein
MRKSTLPLLAILFAFHATPAGKFALTVDNIMRGPGLYGYEPSQVRWSGDSERLYFQWKQASDPVVKDPDTYVVNRDGSGLRKLSEAEAKIAPPAFGATTPDKKRTVYSRDGDIFFYDATSGQTRQLTKTADAETDPHFTQDSRRVAFMRANNLYVMSLDDGRLEELTDIRLPGAASSEEHKGTDSQEFLKKQEKELLEVIRDRAAKREEDEARRKHENPRKPFNLTAGQTITSLRLTPDEKYVIAGVREAGKDDKNAVVPNYVTESGYTEDIPSRDKVGDNQNRMRLAIVSVETGEVKWVDHGQKEVGGAADAMRRWNQSGAAGASGRQQGSLDSGAGRGDWEDPRGGERS